jgi:hypothetical protein
LKTFSRAAPGQVRERFLISFDYFSEALREMDRFFRDEHRVIAPPLPDGALPQGYGL